MRVGSYAEVVRTLQPVIPRIYAHLETGLAEAVGDHQTKGDDRHEDPWFFLHQVRRRACRLLMDDGLQAVNEDGDRGALPMSAIVIHHQNLAIRVMHAQPHSGSRDYPREIPGPGRSVLRQEFWSQWPAIPGLQTDNLLLLWLDDGARVVPRMTLVRPLGGSHLRRDLRIDWSGRLLRSMATLRDEDLRILRPENDHVRLHGRVDVPG